jgi:hypothetical protein
MNDNLKNGLEHTATVNAGTGERRTNGAGLGSFGVVPARMIQDTFSIGSDVPAPPEQRLIT